LGKLESTIKSEIQRLTKREIRATFVPLRREVRAMRLKLSGLSRGILSLNRMTKDLRLEETKPRLEANPEEVKASRLTPDRIRGLRKKLGISMRELGVLTGSSLSSILSWEKGKFKPRGDKKAALVALRKLKKREVRKMLLGKGEREKAKTESKKRVVKRVKKPRPKKRIVYHRKQEGLGPREENRKNFGRETPTIDHDLIVMQALQT
jgi:DNA-binding transcriptional regulator YiaG